MSVFAAVHSQAILPNGPGHEYSTFPPHCHYRYCMSNSYLDVHLDDSALSRLRMLNTSLSSFYVYTLPIILRSEQEHPFHSRHTKICRPKKPGMQKAVS